MILTVEAQIDENGNVTILQPIEFSGTRRALVVILDEAAFPTVFVGDDDSLTAARLESENQVWAETLTRHADTFAQLKAQAKADVAAGKAKPMFDDDGEFIVE